MEKGAGPGCAAFHPTTTLTNNFRYELSRYQAPAVKRRIGGTFFCSSTAAAASWPNPDEIRQKQLSRSLAAFAVSSLADLENVTAAISVVDDFEDNGIDAIHFDRPTSRLFLVQSKFKQNGAAPNQGEMKKFCDGVRDLLAQQYDRFNDALAAENAQAAPNVQLTLENWYPVQEPFRAIYGQVAVSQLAALFATHQKALFERNIRNYMGSSGVNDAISQTLRDEPTHPAGDEPFFNSVSMNYKKQKLELT